MMKENKIVTVYSVEEARDLEAEGYLRMNIDPPHWHMAPPAPEPTLAERLRERYRWVKADGNEEEYCGLYRDAADELERADKIEEKVLAVHHKRPGRDRITVDAQLWHELTAALDAK